MKTKSKTVKYSKKLEGNIEQLPKLYMVGRWARYGVWELPYSGRTNAAGVPLVWQRDDCNGCCDIYRLTEITMVTTGEVLCWTPYKEVAELIAECLNSAISAGESPYYK